ncbi:MAG: hypothetical protein L3K23_08985 [Thermoplasmata archaeon]|nr:hypothetical protein [Thermoplasmata archaeon]
MPRTPRTALNRSSHPAPLPGPDQSVLIHGSMDDALAVVAVGIAVRARLPFAWAEFADPRSELDPSLRSKLAEFAASSLVEVAGVEGLRTPAGLEGSVERLIRSGTLSRDLQVRLDGFLHFPPVVQRLASGLDPAGGHLAILLTGLHVLPERLRSATVARRELHEALHREGISLVATFHGTAPGSLAEAFDRVLRIEASAGGGWRDAVVGLERGPPGQPTPPDERLSSLGRDLRLGAGKWEQPKPTSSRNAVDL